MEILILSDEEVKGLISMRDVMDAVELAFREKGLGRVQMPLKSTYPSADIMAI